MYETASPVTMKPTRQIWPSVQNVPLGQRRWYSRIPPEKRCSTRGIPNQHVLALDQNAHLTRLFYA